MTETDPAAYFSDTYAEANLKFRQAADRHGIAIESRVNSYTGPSGEQLETLVAEIGDPNARNVVFINTGVHGTEALAGSAIITGLLEHPEMFLANGPDYKLVLIHILNPYGCAWSRYVNEDNVDLMKNISLGRLVTPEDPFFVALDDLINLSAARDPQAWHAAHQRRSEFISEHGFERVMASLKKGQSDRPKSICYNGRSQVWSTRQLYEIITRHASHAGQILFVDLHTGVGAYGEAYVIAAGPADSKTRIRSAFGPDAHEDDLVMPVPLYAVLGELVPDALFTAVTIEAGTVEFGDDFRDAMWLEMHDHMYGDPRSPEALANKRKFRSFYYPEDTEWRRLWWGNAKDALSKLAMAMKNWKQDD